MSEPQAAMGLAVLPHIDNILNKRKAICDAYTEAFKYSELQLLKIREHTNWNYSYFPVIFKSEAQLLNVKTALEKEQISTRRYFYPSLNNLPYVSNVSQPNSESISKRVLCLPLYIGLELSDLKRIINIINHKL